MRLRLWQSQAVRSQSVNEIVSGFVFRGFPIVLFNFRFILITGDFPPTPLHCWFDKPHAAPLGIDQDYMIGNRFLQSANENSKVASSSYRWATFMTPTEISCTCAGLGSGRRVFDKAALYQLRAGFHTGMDICQGLR